MYAFANNISVDFKSNDDLIQLSEKLRLSNSERKNQGCLQAIHNIVTCLNQTTSFKIDRIKPCGSFEKGTALGYIDGEAHFDIDMVVFINSGSYKEYIMSRQQYVREMRRILEQKLHIRVERELELSLKFTYNNWSFDLLPALNAYRGMNKTVENQVQAVVQIIHENHDKEAYDIARELSTSLAENAVQFVYSQPPLIRDLIILGKYWFKKKLDDVKFYGRSTTIECIAIYAGYQHVRAQCSDKEKLSRMFREFLTVLKDIQNAAIEFQAPSGFVEKKYIDRKRPYILDPTNPYNNLARAMRSYMPNISQIAAMSLSRF